MHLGTKFHKKIGTKKNFLIGSIEKDEVDNSLKLDIRDIII